MQLVIPEGTLMEPSEKNLVETYWPDFCLKPYQYIILCLHFSVVLTV